jgi:hypothetical protein
MKHTHVTRGKLQAQCTCCGTWFTISRELEILIEEGIISPLDVNLCPLCAEDAEEQAIFEAELECLIFNM